MYNLDSALWSKNDLYNQVIPSLNKKTLTTQEQISSCVVFFYYTTVKKS